MSWARVRTYLRKHRYELAAGFPPGLAGTPLLSRPSWVPAAPIPLSALDIALTRAPAWHLPAAPGDPAYPSYSAAMAALDAPTVFENRPTWRLVEAGLTGPAPRLVFGDGWYFDSIDTGEAAAHEYAAARLDGSPTPLRDAIGDPTDLLRRPANLAISALTIRQDPTGDQFLLHWRDPAKVGHAGGLYQVVPVGVFQSAAPPTTHTGETRANGTFVGPGSPDFNSTGEHRQDRNPELRDRATGRLDRNADLRDRATGQQDHAAGTQDRTAGLHESPIRSPFADASEPTPQGGPQVPHYQQAPTKPGFRQYERTIQAESRLSDGSRGGLQPGGEHRQADFDLWRFLVREYAEELLGEPEVEAPDYETWPFARAMTAALDAGDITADVLGLGVDPLTFATDLLVRVVISAPVFDELFGARVAVNDEGAVSTRPFTPEAIEGLPMQAAGAALVRLALAAPAR